MDNNDILISAEQLAARITDTDLRVLDCRFDLFAPAAGRTAYLAAHIPGAVYADLDADLAAPINATSGRHPLPSVADCAATFARMGISENTFAVVYDERNGAVAARAWWMLRWLGHARVAILDGGFAAWQARQLPLEAGQVSVATGSFVPRPQTGWIIETDEILGAIASGMPLIDARAANRFAGLQEPIDTVAGHIPGASNLPFDRSLDADGFWRAPAVLRSIWAEVFSHGPQGDWSVMCGSGVTACHLAVSARLAGLREPRLYVGSWSEWIRDRSRPIALD